MMSDIRYFDYTLPLYDVDAGVIFNVLYYGVIMPVCYFGNLFTYIIACKILRHRHSTADILVGGLALNDVLTAVVVFTPSIISAARGRYFGDRMMCEFSSVTTVWYIYTTFAMIVLINAERWLAITKPFFYKRMGVTGLKLKVLIGLEGLFCLLLASMPLLRYPVVLKAGWYCAPVNSHYVTSLLTDNLTSTTNDSAVSASGNLEICPVLETIVIKIILLLVGIAILIGCNVSVALELRRRPFGDAVSREMDRKFAIIMGVVALLFLLTWLPNLAAQLACLKKFRVCHEFEFWAMRIVNVGVAVNPIVYGVMKTTYRRGYLYLARMALHYFTCTLLPRPEYGEEIFDLRERFRSNSAASVQVSNIKRRNSLNHSSHLHSLSFAVIEEKDTKDKRMTSKTDEGDLSSMCSLTPLSSSVLQSPDTYTRTPNFLASSVLQSPDIYIRTPNFLASSVLQSPDRCIRTRYMLPLTSRSLRIAPSSTYPGFPWSRSLSLRIAPSSITYPGFPWSRSLSLRIAPSSITYPGFPWSRSLSLPALHTVTSVSTYDALTFKTASKNSTVSS